MAIPEKPITRKETFLAGAAGQQVTLPEPITREEMLLKQIADGGGGGGGGSGAVVRTYTGTLASIVSANNIDIAGLASAFLSNGATSFLTYEQEVMERVKKMHEALIRGEIPEEPEETEAEQFTEITGQDY